MPRLTKGLVASLTPQAAEFYVWDSDVPRFGVKVNPKGRKTYIARYRLPAGGTRKFTIGRVEDLMPEQAREQARRVFAQVAEGRDPALERRTPAPRPMTVAEFSDRFQKEHVEAKRKPGTATRYDLLWRLHILPRIGAMPLAAVSLRDVVAMHTEIGKQRRVSANRAVLLLSKAFNSAEQWGLRPINSNPCRLVEKFHEQRRERALTVEELGRLGPALDAYAGRGRCQAGMSVLVRLLLLTGCRLNELRLAKRAQLDRENRLLRLADTKTTTTTRRSGQDLVYLSPEALAVIDSLPRVLGNPHLIPGGTAGGPVTAIYRRWTTICDMAGIVAPDAPAHKEGKRRKPARPPVRIHDLRHTVGTMGHEQADLTQRQIASVLRHTQMATTERYLHDQQRRESSEKVAGTIAALMRPKARARR